MSGLEPLAIAAGLVADAGLKATALFVVGGAAAQLLRGGSAAQRHAVWTATFASLPLLVVSTLQRSSTLALDLPWLAPVWLCGAVLASLPLLRGLVSLRRLRRGARPHPHAEDLLYSDELTGPLTFGFVRPIILLPSAATGWDPVRLQAAINHERAHVARRDWAVHIAVWAVCVLFWFHPLAWLARRSLAQEAEHAADDAALAEGVRPSDYAGLLVSLTPPPVYRGALGAGSSMVANRVRAVLDSRSRSPRRGMVLAAALALCASVSAVAAPLPLWSRPPASSLTCTPGPNG